MSQNSSRGGNFLLPLALGMYFFAIGVQGLVEYNSVGGQVHQVVSNLVGSSSALLNLVTAVIALVAGLVLIVGPFGLIHPGVRPVFVIIIMVFWVLKSVQDLFINQRPLDPQALLWLRDLALSLVVLAALWQVRKD